MLKKENKKNNTTIAPGMNDQEELEESATKEEINKGDFTSVTTMS